MLMMVHLERAEDTETECFHYMFIMVYLAYISMVTFTYRVRISIRDIHTCAFVMSKLGWSKKKKKNYKCRQIDWKCKENLNKIPIKNITVDLDWNM